MPSVYLVALLFFSGTLHADIQSCLQANAQLSEDAEIICSKALLSDAVSVDDKSIIYVTQAAYLIKKKRFNEAENVLGLAFNINPKMLENGRFRYNWLRTKGVLYFTQEAFVSALPFFEQAVDVAEIMQSNKAMATSYNDLGATFLEIDQYTEALTWLQKCLAIYQDENNSELSSVVSANIAEVYLITEDFESALVYFNSSVESLQKAISEDGEVKQGREVSLAKIFLSMAGIHQAQNNQAGALDMFNESMRIYQKYDLKGEQVHVLTSIAQMYLQQMNVDVAMSYIRQAEAMESGLEGQDNLNLKQAKVDVLIQNSQWQKAEVEALEGLNLALSKNNRSSELGFLASLATINEQSGQLNQAIAYLKQVELEKEALLENKYDSNRTKLLNGLELTKKQRNIEKLEKEKTLNELKLKQQQMWLVLLFVILISVVAWIAYKVKQRRKNEALVLNDQANNQDELNQMAVNQQQLESLFLGTACQFLCFDLSGQIKFSSDKKEASLQMSDVYQNIWRLTTAALDDEELLLKDLYLGADELAGEMAVMVHQMRALDNLLVCVFIPKGDGEADSLNFAAQIKKYTEFNQLLSAMVSCAEKLPINEIAKLNPVYVAAKQIDFTETPEAEPTNTTQASKVLLVDLMVMCLDVWQQNTGQTHIELAEQSGLWLVSIENGQLRTRTMNRYAQVSDMPNNPRWLQVVKTAHYILSNSDLSLSQRQQLNEKLNNVKNHYKNKALS